MPLISILAVYLHSLLYFRISNTLSFQNPISMFPFHFSIIFLSLAFSLSPSIVLFVCKIKSQYMEIKNLSFQTTTRSWSTKSSTASSRSETCTSSFRTSWRWDLLDRSWAWFRDSVRYNKNITVCQKIQQNTPSFCCSFGRLAWTFSNYDQKQLKGS